MKIIKFFLKLIKIPNIFDKKSDLISNVAVNKLLSPIYFFIILYYLFYIKRIPLFLSGSLLGSISLSVVSTLFYVWCSYFFQPDLDVRLNRPGMNTFPFGATIINSKIGFILSPIQILISKLWYYFWQPYASLSTHRGVTHWPFLSVLLRVSYILFFIFVFEKILILLKINFFNDYLLILKYYLISFYPFSVGFGSLTWFCFCFPVFVSDIAHILIDLFDSKRKGISFCPPQIPRGILSKIFKFLVLFFIKK